MSMMSVSYFGHVHIGKSKVHVNEKLNLLLVSMLCALLTDYGSLGAYWVLQALLDIVRWFQNCSEHLLPSHLLTFTKTQWLTTHLLLYPLLHLLFDPIPMSTLCLVSYIPLLLNNLSTTTTHLDTWNRR